MTGVKNDFEAMLSESADFQKLGFLELNIHPVKEDDIYIFSEYQRLSETDIPKLALTIARRKGTTDVFINIESDSLNKRYKFKSSAISSSEVIPTLETYIKKIRNGYVSDL